MTRVCSVPMRCALNGHVKLTADTPYRGAAVAAGSVQVGASASLGALPFGRPSHSLQGSVAEKTYARLLTQSHPNVGSLASGNNTLTRWGEVAGKASAALRPSHVKYGLWFAALGLTALGAQKTKPLSFEGLAVQPDTHDLPQHKGFEFLPGKASRGDVALLPGRDQLDMDLRPLATPADRVKPVRNEGRTNDLPANLQDPLLNEARDKGGIAAKKGAPQVADFGSTLNGVDIHFDGDDFQASKLENGNFFYSAGNVDNGTLLYRFEISGQKLANDHSLEEQERAYFTLAAHRAGEQSLPVHEVRIKFSYDEQLNASAASYSSLVFEKKLNQKGISMQTVNHGELAAGHAVVKLVESLPFSKLAREFGLVPSSVVHSGRVGVWVTYKNANSSERPSEPGKRAH